MCCRAPRAASALTVSSSEDLSLIFQILRPARHAWLRGWAVWTRSTRLLTCGVPGSDTPWDEDGVTRRRSWSDSGGVEVVGRARWCGGGGARGRGRGRTVSMASTRHISVVLRKKRRGAQQQDNTRGTACGQSGWMEDRFGRRRRRRRRRQRLDSPGVRGHVHLRTSSAQVAGATRTDGVEGVVAVHQRFHGRHPWSVAGVKGGDGCCEVPTTAKIVIG